MSDKKDTTRAELVEGEREKSWRERRKKRDWDSREQLTTAWTLAFLPFWALQHRY